MKLKMINDKWKLQRGFTLVELVVSMGILAIIFAISTIALSNIIPNTSKNTTSDSIINDLKSQQTEAMTKDSNYGVHFETNSYTLFKGDDFASGTEKFTVDLDPTIVIGDVTFPGNQVVFLAGSGDIKNYSSGSDSLTVKISQTTSSTFIKLNQYGATYQ